MAMLVGDGSGHRVLLLERLLARLRRYLDVDTFDGALTGVTMQALGNAAWRHPTLSLHWRRILVPLGKSSVSAGDLCKTL